MRRLIVLCAVVGVAGWSSSGSWSRGVTTYFPMSADRHWEYRLQHLQTDRTWPVVVHSRGPMFVPDLDRPAVIFDEQYPDQTAPVAYFLADGFLQSEIGLSYRTEGGVERDPIGIQPMRVMPMPPRAGMRWTYDEQVFASDARDAGIAIRWSGSVRRELSVSVPAGVFLDCLRVESTAIHRTPINGQVHEYRYVDWYAPNVGLVKSEYSSDAGEDVTTRLELVRYDDDAQAPRLSGDHKRAPAFLGAVGWDLPIGSAQ